LMKKKEVSSIKDFCFIKNCKWCHYIIDLYVKDKIDKYLNDLITEINKPLIDCPHCKGLGVVDFVDTTN
jgi:hypothetical protein